MKVMPAIHKFSLNKWGWVKLGELAEILELKPSEVISLYGALNKKAPDGILPVFTGLQIENMEMSVIIEKILELENTGSMEAAGTSYVPVGWVVEVLQVRNHGFTSVKLEKMHLDPNGESPDDSISITYITGSDNEYWVVIGVK
jgi:hypothetical protein